MSTVMMNGFGFSRFMVESFAHTGGVKQSSTTGGADGSVSTTATTTPASSSRNGTESAVNPSKSELSPDTFSRRSTAETDPDATRDELEPLPLSVQVAYDRVARVAYHAASRIDWHQLRSSTSLWDEKKKLSASSSFAIYTRQSRGMHYVMALGTLSCTLAELESVLRPTTDVAYRIAMAELYSDAFVDGAVRYRSSASSSSSSRAPNRPRAASGRHRSRSGRTGAATPSGTTPARPSLYSGPLYGSTPSVATASTTPSPPAALDYIAKTATFARAHMFAKAQQWTFLECFQPTADGFTVTLSSLSPVREPSAAVPTKRERGATLTGAPAAHSSSAVEHLQGITAAYSVAVVPSSSQRSELLVTFYSKFADDSTTFGPLKRHAFKLTLRAHLLTMARAATRLPMIIRRKRLDALALCTSSPKALRIATNALCICCTATLHFLRAKTRCYACGYFVCDRCSLEQEVTDTSVERTRVCQLCIRRVDHAVYNDRGELADAPDGTAPSRATPVTARDAKTPFMTDALDQIFHTSPERKRTVLTTYVQDDREPQATLKGPHTRVRSSSLSSLASSLLSPPSSVDVEAFASPVDRELEPQEQSLGPDDSVWVDYEDDGDFTGTSSSNSSSSRTRCDQPPPTGSYPVPQNDAHRSRMAQQQLAQLEDVSSLEIICSIASQELECPVAMVTLVASTKTHVVATNCEQYRHAVVPRSESLCAHTVMRDDADDREMALREPLIVAQPALDARFRDLAIVRQRGLRFYCGFPLMSEDGSVVGALCCGDFAGVAASAMPPVVLTPQQTDAMVKLAATASRVMQLRGKDAYKRL